MECREDTGSFLEVEDEVLAEMLEVVRRAAQLLVDEHGACRITSAAGRGAGGLRFLLRPA